MISTTWIFSTISNRTARVPRLALGLAVVGLLGDNFIALEPGAEEQTLAAGEEIAFTESALSIERLIGKFVNNAGLDDEEEKK